MRAASRVLFGIIALFAVAACRGDRNEPTPPPPAPPTATAAPALGSEQQVRLDRLVAWLDEQRETMHVPGLAIAIVQDDQVILARGLGVADIAKQTPVTSDTVFPIGSSTKAFTTTLAAMLVDDGVVSWDDPVSDYLPYFTPQVQSDQPGAGITLRDAMSHRTGFPRMSVLIASPDIPSERILRTAAGAEPWAPFRERFYYSNVMYVAAGTALAEAAGEPWDALVQQRILDPLGMRDTTTSSSRVQADARLATGYAWDTERERLDPREFRPVDNICPAGCVNSNVLDMAQWLRFQLAHGTVDETRLVSEAQLVETWTPQIAIGGGVSYGLGWLVSEWQGQRQLAHGGNVDGFSAQVAMLPESNLGFVMLTNVSVTPLQDLVIPEVWNALLGDLQETAAGEVADFEPYLGEYVANFGQFQDARLTVLVQNGRLALDVPNQQVFELRPPDSEGRWSFALTDEIAVAFVRDADDQVVAMEMHQGGLVFELPRTGYEFPPEIPLDQLERYLGSYHSDEPDVTVTVLIQNNRLAVDWPGEMVYELRSPDAAGRWQFRVTPDFVLEFDEAADGSVGAFTFRRPGFEARFVRTDAVPLPTAEQLRDLHHADAAAAALRDHSAVRMTGTIRVPQAGVEGSVVAIVDGSDRYRVEQDFGDFGRSTTTLNASTGWVESSLAPAEQLIGNRLEGLHENHPLALVADWSQFFDTVAVVRADTLEGVPVYVVGLRRGSRPRVTAYVDAATGDVIRTEQLVLLDGGSFLPVNATYEDFREVAGMRIPFRTTSRNEATGSTVTEIATIDVDVDPRAQWFAPGS